MAVLRIDTDKRLGTINPEIYGQFSEHLGRCIYEGLYVGENSGIPNIDGIRKDVLEALREIKVPVLRWPGGCFADRYFWRDGIGPKEKRPVTIDCRRGYKEDNSFGTHEFMKLCELLSCKAYIAGNLGSGAVKEMMDWIEYMTYDGRSTLTRLREQHGRTEPWKVDYFGIGNENWGCGGSMVPDYYANEYRRFQTYVRDYIPDHKIQKIACGPNGDDYEWTDAVLKNCFSHDYRGTHGFMDGFALHYYTMPGGQLAKKSATKFNDADWYDTMRRHCIWKS